MKNLLALVGVLGLLSATSGFACSMPVPAIGQSMLLDKVLNSEAFAAELRTQYQNDFSVQMKNIKFGNGLEVSLTNGCKITSRTIYLPPVSEGMCPQFSHVESQTSCP